MEHSFRLVVELQRWSVRATRYAQLLCAFNRSNPNAMLFTFTLASVLSFIHPASADDAIRWTTSPATVAPGGPPAIRISGKGAGDLNAAQWNTVTKVDLVGCVPDARITSLRICIKDCQGKDAGYTAKDALLTEAMKTMVRNLPPGTEFTVTVTVSDDRGKNWAVQPATFRWKG